ncbi:c-type cytochrome [Marinospirillum sp. MEB164]|uniref:C-type cytochrome n=1 Tax=Marinospirillum alkalitolerans TaxID=3123374 RepID=A0ABW8PUZ9_9GAMM
MEHKTTRRMLAMAAILGLGGLVALQAQARTGTAEEIAERLRPVGELCLQGMDCGGAPAPAPVASAGARSGSDVYNSICMACHTTGAAGAPMKGDVAAWADRLAQGMDTLYAHSIDGFIGNSGVMPARGGNPNLSDDEVKAAVDYLVDASR